MCCAHNLVIVLTALAWQADAKSKLGVKCLLPCLAYMCSAFGSLQTSIALQASAAIDVQGGFVIVIQYVFDDTYYI